ncbi:MAG: carboxypeptidase regulatory-like domain-containing protein [Fimbriimonadaceae bacterium]|nr:carboxypeptidase regulatory-like domain-containing protein [Fimbriimonadaceae bacterium]
MRHGVLPWFVLFVLLLALGCGGGGGGGIATPDTVNLVGNVVWIETGEGTNPASTVRSGSVSTAAGVSDGFFSLDVPSGTTSVTVTYTPASGPPVVQTFTFAAAVSDTDLGELFIGPSTVTVRGRAVDSSTGSPVAAASVSLAGRNAVSGADGSFNLTGVAYSNTVQSIFHSLQGTVGKTGYFNQFFAPTAAAVGGVVDVGDVSLTPQGSDDTPPPPGNVSVTVTPTGGGATVQALVGATVVRTATSDGNGLARLWLPAGSYTIKATLGGKSGSAPLVLTASNQTANVNVTLQ